VAESDRRAADPDLGPRWTEGPIVGRSREVEAIELFRAATSLPGFSTVSSQRVWRRLNAAPAAGRRWLRPAVLVGLLLAAGAATAASVAVIRALSHPSAPSVGAAAPAVRRGLARPAGAFTPDAPHLVIRAADVPKVAPKAPAAKHPRARRAHLTAAGTKQAPAKPAADPGTLGKETTLFREALALRAARDPRGAITVLDRYAAQYPRGSYAAEVVVLRGELAADAGDCTAASANFSRALAAPGSPGLEERALYGRAACRQRIGDRTGASVDFQRYLERFPAGRWAQHARNALR
jgi:hypothetical protein